MINGQALDPTQACGARRAQQPLSPWRLSPSRPTERGPSHVDLMVSVMNKHFAVLSTGDLLSQLEAPEIDVFTLKRLGFSVQSDVDDAVFARIEELLDHPSLEVRDAAVMAAPRGN